jgi:hypothetical protein
MAWKNTMHVFQTEGAPPSNGKIIFAISGWTQKSSAALVNNAAAKNQTVNLSGNARTSSFVN